MGIEASIEKINTRLQSLKNLFKLKIHIFTYRPWPDMPDDKDEKVFINLIRKFIKDSDCSSWKKLRNEQKKYMYLITYFPQVENVVFSNY